MPDHDYRFEVAFSFAGAHRDKVRAIAEIVRDKLGSEKVFFDEWFEHEILGDDMDVLLQRIYHEQSLMVVADLSDQYAGRPWCQAEARAIRALRFEIDPARDETGRLRILNAKFGDGVVPGVFKTTAHLDGITKTPLQSAELILRRHALLTERVGGRLAAAPACPTPEPPCPYPGMAPFGTKEGSRFYGRTREIDDLVQRLMLQRFLFLIGPSGSGKSSLAAAGLIPAMERDRWESDVLRPGFAPAQTVESLPVRGPEARHLLVVDQFEEI